MTSSPRSAQKSLMRRQVRTALSKINPAQQRQKSVKILRTLTANVRFKKAKAVFTYLAIPGEVQTKDLVKQALVSGKKVFAPRLKAGARQIEICEIRSLRGGLKKGRYGILEPKGKSGIPEELDLIITPGLAFDARGNRLGRGLGYFDRFLKKFKDVPKIGLAFREQMVKKIPTEAHDVPVDQVITD